MSATPDHATPADEAHHEGPIRTPKQLAWAVFFAIAAPVIVIILLANYVSTDSKPAAGSEALGAKAVEARLQRVGSVEVRDANAPVVLKTGEQVYQAQCVNCHGTGLAGAPKFADAAAWGPRIKSGFAALLNSALKGKGAMNAQGGGDFSDVEIARAVVHMANQGGAKFPEPVVPVVVSADAAK